MRVARAIGIEVSLLRHACCAGLCALVVGCSARPRFEPGDQCELNTDCTAPLVCRLGRCRVECRAPRDCAAGLDCVRDPAGLGACQLPAETECTLSSDCPPSLICSMRRCVNACGDDRDCPPGARCRSEGDGAPRACHDPSGAECTLNSDCVEPLICAVDGRCREQCRADRDCRDGTVCRRDVSPAVCGTREAPLADAGVDATTPSWSGAGPPRMAAGLDHTCAAPTSSDMRCWGDNVQAQIGDGTTNPHPTPYRLELSGVTMMGAGGRHTCAVTASGVMCWGANDRGQVGTNSTLPVHRTPAPVSGLPTPITDLSLGDSHTCAIADARLFCWGNNDSGQLGLSDNTQRDTPTEVTLRAPPIQVSAFSTHTCVREQGGRIECFGSGDDGALGHGISSGSSRPVEVLDIDDAIHVAVGSTFACAVRSNGSVWCWGNDVFGQLGDGMPRSSRPRAMPTAALPEAAIEVAAGSIHACARTASAVYCWGDNGNGQIGFEDVFNPAWVPTRVPSLAAVEDIGAGSLHTCVRVSGSEHRCFGANTRRQLGAGSTESMSSTPLRVQW